MAALCAAAPAIAADKKPVVEIHKVITCVPGKPASGLTDPRSAKPICIAPDVIVGTADIARALHTNQDGQDFLQLTFGPRGKARFASFTRQNVMGAAAIMIDGKVVSVPIILEPILGGTVQVKAKLSAAQIDAWVKQLNPPGVTP